MALEGTHIRFAMEVLDMYKVSDRNKYLAGAIYPDSRYVTGIPREKTHPDDFRDWDISKLSDFQKGWLTHLIYDQIQFDIIKSEFPVGPYDEQGSLFWIRLTSIKCLQDIDDMQNFDIRPFLASLDYIEAVNNEPIEKLEKYNQAIQKTYNQTVDLDACIEFWLSLGQAPDLCEKIRKQYDQYAGDPQIMSKVKNLYKETLIRISE
jgi:hypothetical protein